MKNRLVIILCVIILLSGCGKAPGAPLFPEARENISGLSLIEREKPSYAEQFVIDRYEGDYSVIYTADGGKYLIVPENGESPKDLDAEYKVIKRPISGVYMAATAVMGMFDALGKTDAVRFSSIEKEDWRIDGAKRAMEEGKTVYAGKYSLPDYELLLSGGCRLSVQSTMILHSPEVKEKLEELGITVFIDRSSYESHPLGRCEWVKVYGELLDERSLAEELFERQRACLESVDSENTGKSVVCFYISGGGKIVTRKDGDYVSKMIELAGGKNILSENGNDGALSTVTMEPEEFYSKAKDADVIIYDGAIAGEIESVDELTEKNSLLEDFKAVKNGDVWCMKGSFFQNSLNLGEMISDFNKVFSEKDGELKYIYKVKGGGKG